MHTWADEGKTETRRDNPKQALHHQRGARTHNLQDDDLNRDQESDA